MNQVLKLVKKIILGMNPSFIFKSYIISGILFYFFIIRGMSLSTHFRFNDFIMIIWFLCSTLVFPLCNVVWNDLMITLFNGFIVVLPLPFMLLWKLFKYVVLWMVAPFVAPIGILYILLNQKIFEKYNC